MIHLDYRKMVNDLANHRYGTVKKANLVFELIIMEAEAAKTPLEIPMVNQDQWFDYWFKIKCAVINFPKHMIGSIQLYERVIAPLEQEVFGGRAP